MKHSSSKNVELHGKASTKSINLIARERQLTWHGHALRRPNNEPSKIFALYERPSLRSGRRGRTPYELQCTRHIKNTLAQFRVGLEMEQIEELAQSRKGWKKIVAVCCRMAASEQ